jgi:hypothetical protein
MNKVDFPKKPDVKHALEETDKRDRKVIGIFKMSVAADAKTAKASLMTSCRIGLSTPLIGYRFKTSSLPVAGLDCSEWRDNCAVLPR